MRPPTTSPANCRISSKLSSPARGKPSRYPLPRNTRRVYEVRAKSRNSNCRRRCRHDSVLFTYSVFSSSVSSPVYSLKLFSKYRFCRFLFRLWTFAQLARLAHFVVRGSNLLVDSNFSDEFNHGAFGFRVVVSFPALSCSIITCCSTLWCNCQTSRSNCSTSWSSCSSLLKG